ncbi:MAG: SDR family NAD(P)-dependent oxidoreductase, partial [Dehalococcoidales bacterium]|nr:SDR family NAD(P)-dependent oxidoreductase [Dehalococcoidales bacterium]
MIDESIIASMLTPSGGSIAGKVIAITGGGSGLGRATSLLLAQREAKVVVVDINDAAAAETVSAAQAAGGKALAVTANVALPEQVQGAIDQTVATFGRLDVMINNAAILRSMPFLDVTPEIWKLIMSVNVDGVFYGTQFAAKQMIAQAKERKPGELIGRIINVTSLGALRNSELTAVYGTSKAAVTRISKGA